MTGPTRLLILGSPGSGKSSLTRLLTENRPSDVIHLDDLYWGPDWSRPTKADWLRRLNEIVARDSWIIDGNYQSTLGVRIARAEMAIVLDVPPLLCMTRILRRAWEIRRGNRAALPLAVREGPSTRATRDLGALLRMVAAFRRRSFWPLVEELVAANVETLVRVAGPGAQRRAKAVRREATYRGLPIEVVDSTNPLSLSTRGPRD